MSILSWNCRGLGNPWTIRDLCRLVKEKKPKMVFLMETKLVAHRMETVKAKVGFENLFVVDSVGRSGVLVLLWSADIRVDIQNFSRRHINADIIEESNGQHWKFTGFYGHPEVGKRCEAWSLLRHLRSFSLIPWLCVGDFNEIMEESEKFGAGTKPRGQMSVFHDTMEVCNLEDLGFWGSKYT